MQLVDRQYFLKLPSGTVYCKFPLNDKGDANKMFFGISAPSIKGDSIGENDFYSFTLGESLFPKRDADYIDTLCEMQSNLAKEIPFELEMMRDGCFEDENVGFMIFSKEEVQEMITELQKSIEMAYSR